ncbi:MFS family permease [Acidovorax soli]|uniref:MFS family permease n=1 Tax=Acidovorax soli TaxID=592050 RepID=A0A7X0U925_9BURK|nr:MFS transporter [Acidovorax soli]MBB6559080.1 MFS family permease [Acidovorax soli]
MSHPPTTLDHPRTDAAAPAGTGGPIPWAGILSVLFLGVAAGTQMSDRGLQAVLSPAIQQAFGVGDAVIGALHGIAGILIASALAVPLARLADRYSRKHMLLALIAAWTVLTGVSALAPNFALFFSARAVLGVTEFAMIPVVYSLIPDLVGERFRVGANLAFAALMATGASAGFYGGGALLGWAQGLVDAGTVTGIAPWRLAMVLLGGAGMPLLLLGLLTWDPPRGAQQADAPGSPQGSIAAFARTHGREIALFIGAAGGLAIAVQALTPMIALALVRRFGADLTAVGHALGIILLVTNLCSLPAAGTIDRLLRRRLQARARPAVMAAGAALSLPCAALLGLAADTHQALAIVALFLLLTCIANALIPTMLQDLLPADLRARCFAIYSFVIAAFCSLGPVLSGAVSDRLAGGNLLLSIGAVAVPALLVAMLSAGLSAWRPGERSHLATAASAV